MVDSPSWAPNSAEGIKTAHHITGALTGPPQHVSTAEDQIHEAHLAYLCAQAAASAVADRVALLGGTADEIGQGCL